MKGWFAKEVAYALQMGLRPQTLYGIADSPVGLAAWMIDHDLLSYQAISRLFVDGTRYGSIDAQLERGGGANSWITVSITEGKNREVRRVLDALGLKVNRLIRTSYGPFQLGTLQPGAVEEVPRKALKEQLGKDAF